MARRYRHSRFQSPSQGINLDSLVDIVSNNVGILIIIGAFMALLALANPLSSTEEGIALPEERPPEKLLVPWSHPTQKNNVYLALKNGRVQFFDLRPFFRELADKEPGSRPSPVTHEFQGMKVRFFPVTNQIYCLQFQPSDQFGENWLKAQRADSAWRGMLRAFPSERFVLFFWVGGESFELFRQVRQGLWSENYEVGWKPLAEGAPMEICNGFEGSTAFRPQ